MATKYLCSALALVAGVQAAGDFYPRSAGVVELNASNFDQQVKRDGELFMVEYFAPWCGHCKKLKPDYISATKSLRGIAKLGAVNCDEEDNKPLCADVEGLPALKVFQGADAGVTYEGQRTSKKIVEHMKGLLPAEMQSIDKKSHKKFLKKGKKGGEAMPKALIFTKTNDVPPIYRALAMRYEGRMEFAQVSNRQKKLLSQYGVDPPALVVLPAVEEGEDQVDAARVFGGKMTAAGMESFVKLHALPGEHKDEDPIPQMTDASCMQPLCQAHGGLCVFTIVSDYDQKQTTFWLDQMNQVETGRSDTTYSFSWIDGIAQTDFIGQAFDVYPADYPQVVVYSPAKDQYANFVGAFTVEAVGEFLDRMLKGRVATTPVALETMPELAGDTTRCKGMRVEKKESMKPEKPSSAQDPSMMRPPKRLARGGKRGKSHILDAKKFEYAVQESYSNWIVVFHGADFEASDEWTKAARSLNNMVNFGQVDITEQSALAKSYGVEELGEGETVVKVLVGGTDKLSPDTYEGEMTYEALSAFALDMIQTNALAKKLVAPITQESFSPWLSVFPTQPRLILFTDKAEAPNLLKSVALEFFKYISVGFASIDDPLAQQFGITEAPTVVLVQAVIQEPAEGETGNERTLELKNQVFPSSQLSFSNLARTFDQTVQAFPYSEDGYPDMEQAQQHAPSHDEL